MKKEDLTIKNRAQLFVFLEDQMNRAYQRVVDSKSLDFDQGLVKTLLLEFDWNRQKVKQIPEEKYLSKHLSFYSTKYKTTIIPDIQTTQEDGFFSVTWPLKSQPLKMYLDTSTDPARRFWIAYSLADALALDSVIDRISNNSPELDRTWLWPSFLGNVQSKGEFRGFGLDYDHRRFDSVLGRKDSHAYLKMQMWGGPQTKNVYEYIADELKGQVVLSKVRLKYWADDEDKPSLYALEDVKYNGKFTSRGTSFQSHQTLVTSVRSQYAEKITDIERLYSIRTIEDGGVVSLIGDPLFFDLSKAVIEDLDAFCKVVFDGGHPFRIWGTVRASGKPKSTSDCRLVSAVDMHTGGKLFFEVFQDSITMYLYSGTCGNTVARFFTNLQHTLSYSVTGESNDGDRIF